MKIKFRNYIKLLREISNYRTQLWLGSSATKRFLWFGSLLISAAFWVFAWVAHSSRSSRSDTTSYSYFYGQAKKEFPPSSQLLPQGEFLCTAVILLLHYFYPNLTPPTCQTGWYHTRPPEFLKKCPHVRINLLYYAPIADLIYSYK